MRKASTCKKTNKKIPKTLKRPAATPKKPQASKSASTKTMKKKPGTIQKKKQKMVMSEAQKQWWKDRNIDPSQILPGSVVHCEFI